jgi:hypothetical protein
MILGMVIIGGFHFGNVWFFGYIRVLSIELGLIKAA